MYQATRDELRDAPGMTKARARATARIRCEECGGRHDAADCPEVWDEWSEREREDYGGVLGADGYVYSDADPGL